MSDENFSIFHISNDGLGLGKAAQALIDKFVPGRGASRDKIQYAKADAEAEVVQTDAVPAEAALSENDKLMERTARRVMGEHVREQKNMESVIGKAAKLLPPDTPEETVRSMDEDKIAAMLGMFKTVSNEEMQLLWAKILAGEAAKPGSFSKRTAAVVSEMDKEDAELFAAFCQFVWTESTYEGDFLIPIIFDARHEIYKSQGIHHETLVDLAATGLISYDMAGMGSRYSSPATRVVRKYFDATVFLTPAQGKDGYYINYGTAALTTHGKQLFPVCLSHGKVQKNDAFFQYIWEEWKKLGYNPSFTPHA